jgi:hypothetical protein
VKTLYQTFLNEIVSENWLCSDFEAGRSSVSFIKQQANREWYLVQCRTQVFEIVWGEDGQKIRILPLSVGILGQGVRPWRQNSTLTA